MSDLLAKPVVKNKFWIVERNGIKVGTLQTIDEQDGHVVYVHDDVREKYPSISVLSKSCNITFSKHVDKIKREEYDVYGYPSCFKPHNQIFDVKRKLPLFTKNNKSKSFYCAGHYLIKYNDFWTKEFCPKSITLNRYEFKGPFKTEEESDKAIYGHLLQDPEEE